MRARKDAPSRPGTTVRPHRVIAVTAAALVAGTLAASAGSRAQERVYDDSFGNLIVLSPSGYKRIVVGMGHVAAELQAERRADAGGYDDGYRAAPRCHQPAVLWKGRSQMWGLADGEVPTPPVVCD